MTVISIVSVPEVKTADQSLKMIVLFSCIGLAGAFCMMTTGIDLSPAWI